MDSVRLREMLEQLSRGEKSVEQCLADLKRLPYDDIGFARIDLHRELRRGFPEVVFCEGKTVEQSLQILERIAKSHRVALATRASKELMTAVASKFPKAIVNETARTIRLGEVGPRREDKKILVITAGTSDIPVAEEAAVTAETVGCAVERVFDVGVAGIHRLFDQKDKLDNASVIIVVAGMEGALASVVGGIVSCPVIAVPTSVGYGASFNGLAALLAMLNSCAPGVVTVNIDNGFGAGYFAAMVILQGEKK